MDDIRLSMVSIDDRRNESQPPSGPPLDDRLIASSLCVRVAPQACRFGVLRWESVAPLDNLG